jgi:hypothetical protein
LVKEYEGDWVGFNGYGIDWGLRTCCKKTL